MLFSELKGYEIIDKNGERVGLVEDIEFDGKGKIKFLIAIPAGVLGKVIRMKIKVPFNLVSSIEDVVFVNSTLEELKKA